MKIVEHVGKVVAEHFIDKDILEIACGCAEFSIMASSKATMVHCIDLDGFRLLPEAQGIANIRFCKMDATKLSFSDAAFDTVVAYNAIGHLSNVIDKVVAEGMRVLKNGGVFLVLTNWGIDKQVINTKLIPCLEYNNMNYCVETKGKTLCLSLTKAVEGTG